MQPDIKKRLLWILAVVVISGLIRVPIEKWLRREMYQAKMLNPPLEVDTISQMGSSVIFGTLGGLRSMLATYFVLVGHDHFEKNRWDDNRKAYMLATFLEPTEESHWVTLVWHRGINATAWVENRSGLPQFQRDLLLDEYSKDAVELGAGGLKLNPQAIELRLQMASIYETKLKDYSGSSEMYRQMIDIPNAPGYAERFYGYHLAECSGEEQKQKAYDQMLKLYHESRRHHMPTLIVKMVRLQKELHIPTPYWIPERLPETEIERIQFRNRSRQKVTNWVQLPGGVGF